MSLSSEDKIKLDKFLASDTMKNHVKVSWGFRNFMHTQQQTDALVVNIETKAALSALLTAVQALNRNKTPEERIVLRTAAGGREDTSHSASYSATQTVNADIIVRLTGKEFTPISRLPNSNTVRVGASVQIGELDKALYEHHQLVLPSSSLIPYVTVAGLSAAGGHGTGKDQPSFAGLIRGATLYLENGREIHITDEHPDFATIMGANNGLFGVITDLDIECMPAKKMACVMEKRSVAEFMEEIKSGLFQHDPYVSAMYMPTYLPDEATNPSAKNVIVYRWRPVSLHSSNNNHYPLLSDLSQELQTTLGEAVNIPEILRTYPSLIPFYMRHLTAPLAIGDEDELSIGPWHEMMHYRTSFPTDLTEICGIFPVKDQPEHAEHGQEIVRAIEKTIALLNQHAKRGEYPITYGLYFRFLQGTNGGLSFTTHPEGHHVCAMDITTNERVPGYAALQNAMQDFFLNELNGKFHWGKNAPMNLDYKKIYGDQWEETKAALETWHRTYHINLSKSALLNPLFSKVLNYPIPSLDDVYTPAERTASFANRQQVAVNAKKLLTVLGDTSQECGKIKAEIEADLKRNTISHHSVFTSCTPSCFGSRRKQEAPAKPEPLKLR